MADPLAVQARREDGRLQRIAIRDEAFSHYGGAFCQRCGFSDDPRGLELDHINNDGADERRTLGSTGRGHKFYSWLKKQGWPDGYQVLCATCNRIKHEEHREEQRLLSLSPIDRAKELAVFAERRKAAAVWMSLWDAPDKRTGPFGPVHSS